MRWLTKISLGLELDFQLVGLLGLVIQVFELPALELRQLLIQTFLLRASLLQPLLLQVLLQLPLVLDLGHLQLAPLLRRAPALVLAS